MDCAVVIDAQPGEYGDDRLGLHSCTGALQAEAVDRIGVDRAGRDRYQNPQMLDQLEVSPGSMDPKVVLASGYVQTGGTMAGFGRLRDARAKPEARARMQVPTEHRAAPDWLHGQVVNPDGQEIGRFVGPAVWDSAAAQTFFRTIVKAAEGNPGVTQ